MYILHNYVCTYFNHIQADRDNDDWTHICIYVYIAACIARKKNVHKYVCRYCDQIQEKATVQKYVCIMCILRPISRKIMKKIKI